MHLTTWGTFVAPLVHVDQHSPALDLGDGRLKAQASLNISAVVASTLNAPGGSVTATFDLLDSAGATVHTLKASAVRTSAGGESILHASGAVAPAVDLWTIRAPALFLLQSSVAPLSVCVSLCLCLTWRVPRGAGIR